jgi:hypothetical protein
MGVRTALFLILILLLGVAGKLTLHVHAETASNGIREDIVKFLTGVIGIDLEFYTIEFVSGAYGEVGSVELTSEDGSAVRCLFTLLDQGLLTWFALYSDGPVKVKPGFAAESTSLEDVKEFSRRLLLRCKNYSAPELASSFDAMLGVMDEIKELKNCSMASERYLLKVFVAGGMRTEVSLFWYLLVNGTVVSKPAFGFSLLFFEDGRGVVRWVTLTPIKIMTTKVNISKEEAVRTAIARATSYFGRDVRGWVEGIAAELLFMELPQTTQAAPPRPTYEFYPLWRVDVLFAEGARPAPYVLGYQVTIRADTGEVLSEGPIGVYPKPTLEEPPQRQEGEIHEASAPEEPAVEQHQQQLIPRATPSPEYWAVVATIAGFVAAIVASYFMLKRRHAP